MAEKIITPNPVGVSRKHLLASEIEEVLQTWKDSKPKLSWWSSLKGVWFQAVGYVIAATDYFVRQIDELVPDGPDKKASVLEALSDVYDVIVPALLPFFLKPFNKKIKTFVINVIASMLVDFLVDKYRSGNFLATTNEKK